MDKNDFLRHNQGGPEFQLGAGLLEGATLRTHALLLRAGVLKKQIARNRHRSGA
jgi:hypothetical protein